MPRSSRVTQILSRLQSLDLSFVLAIHGIKLDPSVSHILPSRYVFDGTRWKETGHICLSAVICAASMNAHYVCWIKSNALIGSTATVSAPPQALSLGDAAVNDGCSMRVIDQCDTFLFPDCDLPHISVSRRIGYVSQSPSGRPRTPRIPPATTMRTDSCGRQWQPSWAKDASRAS